MAYFYLIASVFCISFSGACAGFFDRRMGDGKNRTAIYNLILMIAVVAEWGVLWAIDFSFDPAVFPYVFIFSAGYALGTIMTPLALRYGPLSLTSLVLQVSVACVTVWGFIFWEDTKVTVLSVVGLALVVISLTLCLTGKKKPEAEGNGDGGLGEKKVTGKWILFAALLFFGNAACSIAQREEQIRFAGVEGKIMNAHGAMLMFFATLLSLVAGVVLFLCSPKQDSGKAFKRAGYIPVISATLNVLLNLFVILMAGTSLSPAVIYPVLAVGGLAISILISLVCFRERLTRLQWLGLLVGAVAVVLLNLG